MAKRVPEVITCKAVVCWGLGEPVKLEEIQVEPPKASEVRIKVLNASVCHTDVICIDRFPAPLFPRVLGHEGVGKVESVGEGVKDLKEGDLVVPTFIGECRECENCVSGKSNLCLKYPVPMSGLMYDGTSRMSINGQKLYHVFTCATWSEYAFVDTSYVVKVDPTMALSRASFVSCGFTTGFGAAWKTAGIEEGSTVAVIGLGAVGLGAIEGARIREAAKVIGVDINEKKKTKGEVFGVTDFINPKESEKPMFELIKDLTGGMGVDYCFECTGGPTSVNQALLATKMGKGQAFVIGAGLQKTVEVTFIPLLFGGNLKGCIFGGLKAKTDFPLVIEKGKTKEIHLDELMTHEVSLQDINKAFEMLKQPDCLKILIKL